MKNIKRVEIKNFQSHQKTVMELDEGFNVITGPSDEGKSAIIRALNWVFYNQPSGTDYIRVGTSRCEVKVEFNNGYKIVRSRTPSNSRNRYEIINPEGEKQVFEKVGRSVPQEVVKIHGMPKIEFDQDFKMNLNFDHQLGGSFLLDSSQANSAKVIGGLLDVHLVDSAIRDTTNDLTTYKRQEKDLEEQKEEVEEGLKEFDHLPDLKLEIERKEELLKEIKRIKSKLETFKSYHESLTEINAKIKRNKKLNDKLKNLTQIKEQLLELEDKESSLERLTVLEDKLKKTREKEEKLKKLLIEMREIEKVKDIVNQLKINLNNYSYLKEFKQGYEEKENRIIKGKDYLSNFAHIDEVMEIKKELIRKYDNLVNLKKMKGQLVEFNSSIKEYKRLIKKLPSSKEENKLKENLAEKSNRLERLQKLIKRKKEVEEKVIEKKGQIEAKESRVEELVDKYSDLLKKVGKCPTCYSKVDEELIAGLINQYKE
ncbi:MAG: AAA family ATPase [Halanaerobacter sp.]